MREMALQHQPRAGFPDPVAAVGGRLCLPVRVDFFLPVAAQHFGGDGIAVGGVEVHLHLERQRQIGGQLLLASIRLHIRPDRRQHAAAEFRHIGAGDEQLTVPGLQRAEQRRHLPRAFRRAAAQGFAGENIRIPTAGKAGDIVAQQ